MKAFICILGSVKQVRLGGSGCVGRLASFSKSTFGWHLFLISAGDYPKTYTAACSSTESIPYCWYHPAYLTALSSELLLPRPARSSSRRCTSEVPRLQVLVVIPLCVCVCVCACVRVCARACACVSFFHTLYDITGTSLYKDLYVLPRKEYLGPKRNGVNEWCKVLLIPKICTQII